MTTLTVATVNDDWASSGSNYADVADVDVVLIQEGKRARYAKMVDPKTHGVLQNIAHPALAGSVIIWALAAVTQQKSGFTFGVKADGLLTRYLAWLRSTVAGRPVLFIAAHRPPKRTAKWWRPFDLALAARVRRAQLAGRLVIVGIDTNEHNHTALALLTGLVWHSTDDQRIDGFLMSRRIKVTALTALPKDTSDHQPLVATVEIPVPRKVAPKKRAPKPYAKTTRDGHSIDQLTNYALYATEARLKYTPGSLTVVQGSYNGGSGAVAASAGTHDGGGVIDLTAVNWEEKVHALRAVGFAAWHRPFNWDGRGGGEHIHAVLIGNERLSPSAGRQVTQYRNHTNGLANFAADNTWHPNPIPTFHMPKFAQPL